MMASVDEQSSRLKKFIEENAQRAEPAGKAIGHLFPKYARVFETFETFSGTNTGASKFRISNRDYASSYFRLNPRTTLWSKEELDEIFRTTDPQSKLCDVERKIAAAPESDRFSLRRMLLDHLESAFDANEIRLTDRWLAAIVLYSPIYIRAPDELAQNMFSTDFITRLERVIFRGLRRLSEIERVEVFETALKIAKDMTLLCSMFRTIAGDAAPDNDKKQNAREFDFGSQTDSLRRDLVERVRVLADSGLLWEQADPERLLWFWAGAGHQEEVIRFTYGAMENPIALRVLLNKTVSLVRSTAGNYERVSGYTGKIIDLNRLEHIALKLAKGNATGPEAQLAQRFLQALERGRKESD